MTFNQFEENDFPIRKLLNVPRTVLIIWSGGMIVHLNSNWIRLQDYKMKVEHINIFGIRNGMNEGLKKQERLQKWKVKHYFPSVEMETKNYPEEQMKLKKLFLQFSCDTTFHGLKYIAVSNSFGRR